MIKNKMMLLLLAIFAFDTTMCGNRDKKKTSSLSSRVLEHPATQFAGVVLGAKLLDFLAGHQYVQGVQSTIVKALPESLSQNKFVKPLVQVVQEAKRLGAPLISYTVLRGLTGRCSDSARWAGVVATLAPNGWAMHATEKQFGDKVGLMAFDACQQLTQDNKV